MDNVIVTLVMGLAVFALEQIVVRIIRASRRRIRLRAEAEPPPPPHRPASDAPFDPLVPEAETVLGKILWLENVRDTAAEAAVSSRSRGISDEAYEERRDQAEQCLARMTFIEPEDMLEERYRLLAYIGGGRLAVVWKAYDLSSDRVVALKMLRHPYVNDESIVRQFRYTARVMGELHAAAFTAVQEDVRNVTVNDERKLVYYVLEFTDGLPLQEFMLRHPERRQEMVNSLLEVGNGLAAAHASGVVHRDIKPSNIVVEPSGRFKIVDFDAVLRLGDRQIAHHDMGTFGYSAPEVLNGTADPDVRADIFAVGRVFACLYYGKQLPSSYEMSVYDVIDMLNCAPIVKETLEKASSIPRARRYASMTEFLTDMKEAVQEDAADWLPFGATITREWEKISRLLRHSFVGTLVLMLAARPLFTHFQMAQLSDTGWVAGFHGIIGSFVWGTFISGAYVLHQILFGRATRGRTSGHVLAMAMCGLGGFLGGALVSVPSVLVTNPQTLKCLGWLTPDAVDRVQSALMTTRMMLAYPITGLLTGCGVGLCLHRVIERALKDNPQGSGLLPVPTKHRKAALGDMTLMSRALLSPTCHMYLLFPFLFAFVAVAILDPSLGYVSPEGICVQPREVWRAMGEGAVHYFGAVGLMIGFFWGVVPPAATPASEAQ